MRRPALLLNTARVEAWPGGLLAARGNQDARALAGAGHVFRRKRDGRYLAVERDGTLHPLRPGFRTEPGLAEAMAAVMQSRAHRRPGVDAVETLPLDRLQERLDGLGLDADGYAARTGLALVAEPAWLALAGFDRYRRALWLLPAAALAWQRMQSAALADGVMLDAISGYRSHDYQLGIFERKLARGLSVDEILTVNAAPGFSEHHGGRALDIGTADEPPAEASFEGTAAFRWLAGNAAAFGFSLSYPRGNPHGITYEPWHWAHSTMWR
jgi:D-alanyl-D-alanine carboxypeptidase